MRHLGDITKIKGDEIEPVDIIVGGSPCFPAGTLVLSENGYKPIEEITVGELVCTHLGHWMPVEKVGGKRSNTIILKGNHYGLECTPNHPFFSSIARNAFDGSKRKRDVINIGWCAASNMLGKRWAVPTSFDKLDTSVELSEDLMYVVGRYLGDGWLNNGQRNGRPVGQYNYQIVFAEGKHDNGRFGLSVALHRLFNTVNVTEEKTAIRFRVYSKKYCEWINDNFGKYSYGKRLPGWVYGMDDSLKKSLLLGYLDSDGSFGRHNERKVTTVSKQLAHGIRLLAETLGYTCTIHKVIPSPKKVIEGRTVNQRPYYDVRLTNTDKPSYINQNKYHWYQVKSMLVGSEDTVVYNLQVAQDHSYIVEGFAVHNCQDLSVAGLRNGLAGERSGLFMEQMRIVREMRRKDMERGRTGQFVRCRFLLWENVCGAFSSGEPKGADFKAVLEECVKAAVGEGQGFPDLFVPKNGWTRNGCLYDEMGRWSIAWAVHDSKDWCLPQRRSRISLVCDFGGTSAPEILFERKGVAWNSEEKQQPGESSRTDIGDSD